MTERTRDINIHVVDGMVWPTTIVATRYGGAYEGGPWAAFHCHPHELDDLAPGYDGGDVDCMSWWGENSLKMIAALQGVAVDGPPPVWVATGKTPSGAHQGLRNLARELRRDRQRVPVTDNEADGQ